MTAPARRWRSRLWPRAGRPSPAEAATAWLVVGLGNPGPRYEATRHNVGRRALEAFAGGLGARLDRLKHDARFGRVTTGGQSVCLATPTTYMNESGRAVAALARFFRVAPERVLVVCDDLDLPVAQLRIRPGGGHGGHNGLASVLAALASSEVPRLRIGIGRPPPEWDAADYVLAPFAPHELAEVEAAVTRAAAAIGAVLRDGLDAAMNEYN